MTFHANDRWPLAWKVYKKSLWLGNAAIETHELGDFFTATL